MNTSLKAREYRLITNSILQGESLPSILCSNTMERVSKECKLPNYKYRNKVELPKMSFVDDLYNSIQDVRRS